MVSRKTKIHLILEKYKYLFDRPDTLRYKIKKTGRLIYAPYVPRREIMDGISLKDGVGLISIFEIVDKNKVVSYNYRFFSKEYICWTCKKESRDKKRNIFEFHYDKSENDNPHKPHLQVIYPSIRYSLGSVETTLDSFLFFIQETFFTQSQSKYIKKEGNIWHNRR